MTGLGAVSLVGSPGRRHATQAVTTCRWRVTRVLRDPVRGLGGLTPLCALSFAGSHQWTRLLPRAQLYARTCESSQQIAEPGGGLGDPRH